MRQGFQNLPPLTTDWEPFRCDLLVLLVAKKCWLLRVKNWAFSFKGFIFHSADVFHGSFQDMQQIKIVFVTHSICWYALIVLWNSSAGWSGQWIITCSHTLHRQSLLWGWRLCSGHQLDELQLCFIWCRLTITDLLSRPLRLAGGRRQAAAPPLMYLRDLLGTWARERGPLLGRANPVIHSWAKCRVKAEHCERTSVREKYWDSRFNLGRRLAPQIGLRVLFSTILALSASQIYREVWFIN